jgi:hypothetical protein
MESVISVLKNAKSGVEVEEGLNLISTCHRDDILQSRHSCAQILNELSANENLMNAKLRRKLKRTLQFILSDTPTESGGDSMEIASILNLPSNPSALIAELKSCLALLQNGEILTEIEESITKLPLTEFLVRDENVDQLITTLEQFPDRTELQINAKLRRRVKRMIETLTNLKTPDQLAAASTVPPGRGGESEEEIVVTAVKKVPLAKTLELLSTVRTFSELEYALNSMDLPDFQAIKIDPHGQSVTCHPSSSPLRLQVRTLSHKSLQFKLSLGNLC